MKLIWDETKRLANLDKHGFDFEDVVFFDWQNAVLVSSHSNRIKAIGHYRNGAAVVIYATLGTEAISIVSFRIASPKERKLLNDENT